MTQAEPAGTVPAVPGLRVRKAIGWIGVTAPFALYIGNKWVHPNYHPLWPDSLSGYYHTHMRVLFMAQLGALAVLLIVYTGHDRADRWITTMAGLLALGAAFFPTTPTRPPFYHGPALPSSFDLAAGRVHMTFAVALFLTLALMTLRFTKSSPGDAGGMAGELRRVLRALWYSPPGPSDTRPAAKRARDAVQRVCARLILATMALAAISKVIPASVIGGHAVFFLEAVTVFCVGLSWLVKGQAILADSGRPLAARLRGRVSGAAH